MKFPSEKGEMIQVLTAGTKPDPYTTDDVEDWNNPTSRTVKTVAPPEPRPMAGETEQLTRNTITSGWTLYLPAGDPINYKNRVSVRGVVYPVQGTPSDWGMGVVVQAFHTEG